MSASTRDLALGGRSIRGHAARGTMIIGAFTIGLAAIGALRNFVVAAFLTPEEFGVWGILVVALGTLIWLKQVGIGDKFVQQDEEDQELAFQRAFTLEAIVTGGLALLMVGFVPLAVVVYGHDEILAPGFACVLLLPAMVLRAPIWVAYRRMDFLRQRTLLAIEPVVGFVVVLGLAIAGAGFWALVIGQLVGMWASALAAVITSPYALRWRFDRATARSYIGFSWPLLALGGTGIVIAQGSVLLGNIELGLAGAGAVALAASITQLTDRIDGMITGALYPAICAAQDRMDLLRESFVKSNRLALIWAMPFGLGLALFAADLVEFVLGDRWEVAVPLLQAMGVIAAVGHLGFNWSAYFRARAETRPLAVSGFAAMLAFFAVSIPLTLLYGLEGFAVGMAAQTLCVLACRWWYLHRTFDGFNLVRHAVRSIVPSLPPVALVLVLRMFEDGERTLLLAVGELALYLAFTAILTAWLERALLREAIGYLRRRNAPAAPVAAAAA